MSEALEIAALVDAGFTPESVLAAYAASDLRLLVHGSTAVRPPRLALVVGLVAGLEAMVLLAALRGLRWITR